MLKRTLYIVFAFLSLFLYAGVFNYVNFQQRPKHAAYIPANNTIIIVMNLRQFTTSISKIALFNEKDFNSLLLEQTDEESMLFKEGTLGIDFKTNVSLIIDDKSPFLFADLADKAEFEKFLIKNSYVIQDRGGYFLADNNKNKVLFNEYVLIWELTSGQSVSENKMLKWIKKDNAVSEEILKSIYDLDKHISMHYISTATSTFDFSLFFNKDAIDIEADFLHTNTSNSEIISTTDISFFEKNNFAIYASEDVFNISLNDLLPEEINGIQIIKELFGNYDKKCFYAYADDVVSSHIYMPKVDKTVSDYKKLPFYMPVFRVAFSVQSAQSAVVSSATSLHDTSLITHQNYFEIKLPDDYSLYFKIFEKHISLSVDTNFIGALPTPQQTGFSYFYYSNIDNYTQAIPTFSPDGFMIKSFLEMKSKINRIYIYATHANNNRLYFKGKAYIGNEQIHSLIETMKILRANMKLIKRDV